MNLFTLNRGARIAHNLFMAQAAAAMASTPAETAPPPPPANEQTYLLRRSGESRQAWRARVRAYNKLKGQA